MGVLARNLAVAGAIFALAAVTASAGSAHGVRTYSTGGTAPLATALADPWLFNSSQRERALAMTRAAGASYVRLTVSWSSIAPSVRPDGFVATDPTSKGYNWSNYDAIVKQVEDAGLTPILDIEATPKWAFAKRPKAPNAGTPRVSDLGAFAKAIAKHYDGSGSAPAVHVFQVWNEPNVSLYLNPVKASVYRSMVNAFAASVHGVNSKNLVVAGALDPFGHKRSKKQRWNSVAPLAFMRSLLCVSKGKHPHSTCRTSVHFDAWSHHPYTFGGAFGHARNPDDVELGDLPKMRTLLRAALRFHHIRSTNGVRFWITEFGWDTNPPRRHAAPMGLASRWTAESLYQAWRSGVSLLTWFGLQDRGGKSPYQSGLFRHASSLARARVKPVRTAFRFPFVAYLGRGKVTVWGRDATSNKQTATIQLRRGTHGHWRTVARIRANKFGIFKASLRLKATKKSWLRASAPGSGTSLAFSLTVPHDPHIGPWGN
ncbi:MAG: cellulase family glycosylhydrolase [Gaiellaceae bacterium]